MDLKMISEAVIQLESEAANVSELSNLEVLECYKALPDRAVFKVKWNNYIVVLKFFRTSELRDKSNGSFEALKSKQAWMSNGDLRVVKPLKCFSNQGILIMEFLEGTRLDYAIADSPELRQPMIVKSGAWLNAFIKGTHSESPIAARYWLDRAEDAVSEYKTSNTSSKNPNFTKMKRAHELLQEIGKNLIGERVNKANTHGDFAPINLMLNENTLTGFDIQSDAVLPIAHDIARFLCQVQSFPPDKAPEYVYGIPVHDLVSFETGYGKIDMLDKTTTIPFFYGIKLITRINETQKHKRENEILLNRLDGFNSYNFGG